MNQPTSEYMELLEGEAETNMDYKFLYTIYSFLGLLIFFIVFSLGKVIYHYYKTRGTLNVASAEDTIHTECHSVSVNPSVTDTHTQNNECDPDVLGDQLDKLRRLLNRLNAMGTFSRDTIGDLSAQSAVYLNNSVAASSDLSAFWSSIDFDDFEESTINEGNFRKTPTERSVSPSVSDFSLDTSGLHDNFRRKNMATYSRDNVHNPSAFNPQNNPSDAIMQILSILDSIMQKRNNTSPLQNNALKIKRNFGNSANIQNLLQLEQHVQSCAVQKISTLSASSMSLDKNLYPRSEAIKNDESILSSKYLSSINLNTEPKRVDGILSSNPNLLDQLSQFINSQYKISSGVSVEAKISEGVSYKNITSDSVCKKFYPTKLSVSSKSLDTKQFSASRSVAINIDPIICLSAKLKGTSESSLAVSTDHNMKTIKKTNKACVQEISHCTIEIEAMNRSHSLSELSDKKSPILSTELYTEKLLQEKIPAPNNHLFGNKTLPVITVSESPQDSLTSSKYDKILGKENTNYRNEKLKSTKNSSSSTRSLQLPSSSDVSTIKPFLSESEMKRSQYLDVHSPNLSSSSSDTFLSPILETDHTAGEKLDWKSPVESVSDSCVSRNLTPHNGYTIFSRKSCIWATPPSPEEEISHVADKINTYKISSIQNLDKCKF